MTEQEQRAALQAYAEAAAALEDANAAQQAAQQALQMAQNDAIDGEHVAYPVVARLADGRQVAIDVVRPGDGDPAYLAYTIGHQL